MSDDTTENPLELRCSIQLKSEKNADPKGFPCRYYANLTVAGKDIYPLRLELPVELYQKLVDKFSNVLDGQLQLYVGKDAGRFYLDFKRTELDEATIDDGELRKLMIKLVGKD